MNAKEGNVNEVVHRFKWHDNNTIQLINSEGLERIIRLDGEFSEVQFHNIPLYMSFWSTHNHYYYDKPLVELDNVNERLRRKYQAYKATTLMKEATSMTDEKMKAKLLYGQLFTVDYLKPDDEDPGKMDRFVIDQSFTFLSWNLVEQL